VKKTLLSLCLVLAAHSLFAAIPTEEGLLRNLNNPTPSGKVITIEMSIKDEFYKLSFMLDKPGAVSMLQVVYSDSQMHPAQMRDVKFIQDFLTVLSKDKNSERSLFYGALLMLASNQPSGMEIFLDKNGVKIPKNRSMMNEEKVELLKSYRTYLVNNRGKGENESPLNPADPQERTKAIALFKSNTYSRSKNITLIKEGTQFFWKVDWKNLQAFFTNEERRLKKLTYKNQDSEFIIEAGEYNAFNGVNELPKNLELKNDKGLNVKIQITGQEVSSKRDFADVKKKNLPKKDPKDVLGFLY
jgi:hypothetical protein